MGPQVWLEVGVGVTLQDPGDLEIREGAVCPGVGRESRCSVHPGLGETSAWKGLGGERWGSLWRGRGVGRGPWGSEHGSQEE